MGATGKRSVPSGAIALGPSFILRWDRRKHNGRQHPVARAGDVRGRQRFLEPSSTFIIASYIAITQISANTQAMAVMTRKSVARENCQRRGWARDAKRWKP